MDGVQIIVIALRDFWDTFYITPFQFSSDVNENNQSLEFTNACSHKNCDNESSENSVNRFPITNNARDFQFSSDGENQNDGRDKHFNVKQCYKTQMNGYLLSIFVCTLKSSAFYRSAVISHLLKCKSIEQNKSSYEYPLRLIIQLRSPEKDIIDYNWNERMLTMALERRELDHAMSWLSTLGGAFSALGDHYDHCAVVAGHISIKQMKLAMQLGDPTIVARCELYLALSLLQRGYLRKAKYIIKNRFHLALVSPVKDTRLIRMCHGIWAKLKYAYQLKKLKQNSES